jgi:hypothetical protein
MEGKKLGYGIPGKVLRATVLFARLPTHTFLRVPFFFFNPLLVSFFVGELDCEVVVGTGSNGE